MDKESFPGVQATLAQTAGPVHLQERLFWEMCHYVMLTDLHTMPLNEVN